MTIEWAIVKVDNHTVHKRLDRKKKIMIPFSTIYELSMIRQREDQETAKRYRLIKEAERGMRERETARIPFKARLGRRLIRWGARLAAGYPVHWAEDPH